MMCFHELLVFIRFNIREPCCKIILERILQFLGIVDNNKLSPFRLFRMELLKLLDSDTRNTISELLDFSNFGYRTDNADEIFRYLPLIRVSISRIIEILDNNNYEQALALLNAIHCLPEALMSKNKWAPRSFWNNRIKLYRRTWDRDFVKKEEYDLLQKDLD